MVHLTIHSYVNKGHTFYLWRYKPTSEVLPKGVIVKDANEIIPEEEIFRKKESDPKFGLGKNSLGTFSDIFRYKLLYEYGGWWTDMDITCLKALNFKEEYYFRKHPILPMIGNVMKCPPKSKVMRQAYQVTQQKCNAQTVDWLLTNKMLNETISDYQLQGFIQDGHSNAESFIELEKFIFDTSPLPSNWFYLHWMNEEWRTRNLSPYQVIKNSTLAQLMKKYNIEVTTTELSLSFKLKWQVNQQIHKLRSVIKSTVLLPIS